MELLMLAVGVALGWALTVSLRSTPPSRRAPLPPSEEPLQPPVVDAVRAASAESDTPPAADEAPAAETSAPTGAADTGSGAQRERAWSLGRTIQEQLEQIGDVATLERVPEFGELVAVLSAAPFDARERANLAPSQTVGMSCAAMAAMAACRDALHADVSRVVGRLGWFSLTFALRYLAQSSDPGVAAAVLSRAQGWWFEHPTTRDNLRRYLDALAAQGLAQADLTPAPADLDGADDQIETLRQLEHPVIEAYAQALRQAARSRELARSMERVGRWFVPTGDSEQAPARTPEFDLLVDTLAETLEDPSRPSFVVVGEPGCGKTTAIRAALSQLAAKGWRVLEATADQIVAGQKYVGEIEQRIEDLIEALSAPRTLWFAPACHTLLERGTWSGNPHGLLDSLMPALEAHKIQIIGESERSAWGIVAAQRPRVAALVRGITFAPTDATQTRALIEAWARDWQQRLGLPVLQAALAQEAMELARQHFPDRAEPGRSLSLLQDALAQARAQVPIALPLTRNALLDALSKRSGIPVDVLDVERRLDVGAIRKFFTDRVMGQDEAVDCLVDRIAMLKAGLTDPRRPLGVFLFAGPTGTGKTEIAKSLAELLFGSADRMLRFDMSEYQSDDAAWRLIDDGAGRRSASLTTRIREQPFSVVLLDEFEKAHPRVWDLFLQVFDDGRLTDRAGSTVSFRHAIVILTSNLGATIERGGGPGFVSGAGGLSRAVVQRAIDATFRREFINRIDQVVIFNSLSRAVMRDILHKELNLVLARRGFQVRDWAVEWQPSAIDFLLEQGFTVDLGARPLRRAIERHVLAPLARSIVEHRAPSGEQFLFVASDGARIDVRFVDPDAPLRPAATEAARGWPTDVRALALDPRADAGALGVVRSALEALRERTLDPRFGAHRERAAAAMQDAAFWQRPDRVAILDGLERIDRIEAGMRSARSLLERLTRLSGRSVADPLRRLALLVYVLTEAVESIERDEPEHAQLSIAPRTVRGGRADAWRDRLLKMYLGWARARGMRAKAGVSGADGRVQLEIGGFGAWRILRHEAGLHVLGGEVDEGERQSALIEVQADPPHEGASPASDTQVVRRYSDAPVPLVRDAVRGWRTGRADRVFEGDFDLFPAD